MVRRARSRLAVLVIVAALVGAAATAAGPRAVDLGGARLAADTAQNKRYVIQVFIDLLGREPSQPVANYFTGLLDGGGSRFEVVSFILTTIEYRSVVVDRQYREFMLRPADPTGQAYFTNLLRAGTSQLALRTLFLQSNEYFVVHGSTNTGFVAALYRDLLARRADQTGLTFWSGELAAGRITRSGFVNLLLRLTESREAVVRRMYAELLNRSPDASGLGFWQGSIAFGVPVENIIRALTASAEYFSLAQTQVLPLPPQAANDIGFTQGAPVVIDVTDNDSDPEGKLNRVVAIQGAQPDHGVADPNLPGPGKITYTPQEGYVGGDHFFYRICDETVPVPLCDTARVRIVVVAPPSPPNAVNDAAATPEDVAVRVDVVANDTDPDGDLDPTTVTVTGAPNHGSTTVDPATGAVDYTPEADFHGDDSFTYRVCDNQTGCDTAQVAVDVSSVNDAPVATADAYATAPSGTLNVPAPGVRANDTDVDGDAVTTVLVTAPTCGTLDTFGTNGAFDYTAPAAAATCTFTYKVNDGALDSAAVTVTITVA